MRHLYHKFYWIFVFVMLIFIAGLILASHKKKPPDISVVTEKQLQSAQEIQKTLSVSKHTAQAIQQAVPSARHEATYYAPSISAVTAHEESHRAVNKADKVVVAKNDDPKKVDVYRITLKKEHKLKAGVTVINNKAYPTVGYQAGRVEGLLQMQGTEIKGATVMYTFKEW